MRQSFTDFTNREVGSGSCAIAHSRRTDNVILTAGTNAGEREDFIMREIREYNINGTIILGVDNGYGNVKTAHRVFQTGITKCDSEPVLTKEYIEYDGAYYIIGEGHKGFLADKQEERSFWRELAKCNQESFIQSGTEGKCIEARELIIALPESFVHYEPEYLLKRFTDHFKQKYKVECISALHHNKCKTNYHIHLIFAERQLLDNPVEKIATRNMFYDEKGKHRRTKKEILDEAGNIRKKCKIVKKGEVYERKLFTKKNELFKADGYLDEVKRVYTDLINAFAIKEEDKLHVFEKNGMYLATKKVGKNNPKAAEIEADNKVSMQWNQTVDRALISGVSQKDILDVKYEKIYEEVKRSIEIYGNRPFFLADIIRLAIKVLELLIAKVLLAATKVAEMVVDVVHEKVVENNDPITEAEIKPEEKAQEVAQIQLSKKPEKSLLLSKYSAIMDLDAELKRRNDEIFRVERERSNLEIELSECSGVFKQKRKKELQEQIAIFDRKAGKMKAELSRVIQDAGYTNAAEFYTELFTVREEKRKYEEACKKWQQECVEAEIGIQKNMDEKEQSDLSINPIRSR